jgi:hypothetical protein
LKTQLSSEVFDEYLKIHISSENPYVEIKEILMTIKSLADENNRTRILVDAVNTPNLRLTERFNIGIIGLDIFRHNYKVAAVIKPEYLNKFLETVVVNRGGRLHVTDNEQEALSWLLQ